MCKELKTARMYGCRAEYEEEIRGGEEGGIGEQKPQHTG